MSETDYHKNNVRAIALRIMQKEFEDRTFKATFPKEAAALESMSYGESEELLVKAEGNYSQIQILLAQAISAKTFFDRIKSMKKKLLLGDPQIQEGSKNQYDREYRMAKDPSYTEISLDLRTAETVTVYLENLSSSCLETLQVVKKIRDAALQRKERDDNWRDIHSKQ